MSGRSRRRFLGESAAALSALALGPGAARAGRGSAELDREAMAALGRLVLPEELGVEGIRVVVGEFMEWLEGFQPVAEQDHPYGGSTIRYGPPDPEPRWRAQLEALDIEARKRHRTPFTELDVGRGRAMVRRQIREAGPGLPPPQEADHVAVALLAYYFRSPAATDRCYGARIAKLTCRPLDRAPDRPRSLEAGGGP